MGPKVGFIINGCFGDVLNGTPILKYMSEVYDKKIHVQTDNPRAFMNSPYVEKLYSVKEGETLPTENIIVHNVDNHSAIDGQKQIRKMHMVDYWSSTLGFILSNEEKTLQFFPDPLDIDIPEGPYVFLNPSITWPSRTWDTNNWKELIDNLIAMGVKVVLDGKKIDNKGYQEFEYDSPMVIDLRDQTTLSQAWHLMQNSIGVVTMDAGILHLAGTTDTNIIHLGSAIDNLYRAPFRNGSQDYKYKYIVGSCAVHCQSDMKFNISRGNKEALRFNQGYPVPVCLMGREKFDCHPAPSQVLTHIESLLKRYRFNSHV